MTALAPSTASPMTWNPSDSSRTRALARKDGWSSTMRTVQSTFTILVSAGTPSHTAGRTCVEAHLIGDGGADLSDHLARVGRAEHRGSRDEHRRACPRAAPRGLRVDPAVDLDRHIGADQGAQALELPERALEEGLTAPTR